jgi:hypothetical protein
MSRAATTVRHSASRATAPVRRSRRATLSTPAVPLGSLTQQSVPQATCHGCGGTQVTRLAMQLTDGTPVEFTSCHRCETRRWEHDGVELSVETVLERTRKTA